MIDRWEDTFELTRDFPKDKPDWINYGYNSICYPIIYLSKGGITLEVRAGDDIPLNIGDAIVKDKVGNVSVVRAEEFKKIKAPFTWCLSELDKIIDHQKEMDGKNDKDQDHRDADSVLMELIRIVGWDNWGDLIGEKFMEIEKYYS